jgi:SAM-dependent methyltransferase
MKRPGSGGTFSSEYCYSVWLRHLLCLFDSKLITDLRNLKNIAEIGPGDSLGIGMAALYSGAENYYAFDVIEHANVETNKLINSELNRLFTANAEIPHGLKLKNTAPLLDDYSFPKQILSWSNEIYEQRRKNIEKALENNSDEKVSIKYVVPWFNQKQSQEIEGIDLIFSQAVMEHVADIEFAYQEMYNWLKKGGVMSHQIDFKTHEMTKEWNGHWFIGEKMWKFLSRGRKYPMNRLPLSAHLKVMQKVGFTIKYLVPVERINPNIGKRPLVSNVEFNEKDLITSGALIQAIK